MPRKLTKAKISLYHRDREQRMARIRELLRPKHKLGTKELVTKIADEFDICTRTVYDDLNEVYEQSAADRKMSLVAAGERAIAEWEEQIAWCKSLEDGGAANKALENKQKLEGVFAATKVEVSVTGTVSVTATIDAFIESMNDDELELFEKLRAAIAERATKQLLPGEHD